MTASASAATVLPVGQKDPPFAEDPVRRELVGGAELDAPARPVVQYHRLAGAVQKRPAAVLHDRRRRKDRRTCGWV